MVEYFDKYKFNRKVVVSIWLHIWKNPDGSGKDKLLRKIVGAEDFMNSDVNKIERGITYFTSEGKYIANIQKSILISTTKVLAIVLTNTNENSIHFQSCIFPVLDKYAILSI